jgi:hypothetical protein
MWGLQSRNLITHRHSLSDALHVLVNYDEPIVALIRLRAFVTAQSAGGKSNRQGALMNAFAKGAVLVGVLVFAHGCHRIGIK